MNLNEVEAGWETWDELCGNELFTVRVIPTEYVILKDSMYPMNYVMINIKMRRPEVLLPSEVAALSTLRGVTEAMAQETNDSSIAMIMKNILDGGAN